MIPSFRLFLLVAASSGIAALVCCTGSDPATTTLPDASTVAPGTVSDAAAATTNDAGAPSAELDAGNVVAVPGELLANPSFEDGNCQGWTGKMPFTSAQATPIAHDGVKGCLVCPFDGANVYSVTQYIPIVNLTDGGAYTASAWVRAADGGDVPTAVTLDVSIDNDGKTGVVLPATAGNTLPRTGAWVLFHQDYTYHPAAGGTLLELEVINHRGDTGCYIVDQASFAPKAH